MRAEIHGKTIDVKCNGKEEGDINARGEKEKEMAGEETVISGDFGFS